MPFNQFETLNLIENEQTQHTNYWGKKLFFFMTYVLIMNLMPNFGKLV